MSRLSLFLICLLVISLAVNVVLFNGRRVLENNLNGIQVKVDTQKINDKTLEFAKLFVDKVLLTKSEVSFDDRLKLENAVRELNDGEILGEWNKFVNSKNETDAQEAVKGLLGLLVHKIKNI